MNQYFKNFILCGAIDHHCLLCQETFHSVADVKKHIRWEKHRKSLKNQTCVPKFKKYSIYKVENYYYCEICNYVIQHLNAVTSHLNDNKHTANKAVPGVPKEFKGRYDEGIVIIKNFVMSTHQWHGINGKHCVLCDIHTDNAKKHMESQDHIIKLIQTEIDCFDDHYYRMINENSFQCFTCKKLFLIKNLEQHWSDKEHCDNLCLLDNKELGSKSDGNIPDDKKAELEEKLIESQKKLFHINMNNKTATCKICGLTVDASFKDMIVHIKEHSDYKLSHDDLKRTAKCSDDSSEVEAVYSIVADHGKNRSELSMYGKQNYIRLNAGGSKGFCMICDKYLSAHKKSFKQHVIGTSHKAFIELKESKGKKTEKKKYRTQTIIEYFENLLFTPGFNEFWVNGECCLGKHSLVLLRQIKDEPQYQKTKCFVCDIVIPHEKEGNHCKTNRHKTNFFSAKVIVVKDEFIREICPNIYHCGTCNEIYPYWDGMNKHLQSWKHFNEKNVRSLRVAKYYTDHSRSPIGIEITLIRNNDILYLQLMGVIFP